MLELKAPFKRVGLVNFGQVLAQLRCRVEFIRNQEGVASQCAKRSVSERRQTPVLRNLRDVFDPELIRNSPRIPVRLKTTALHAAEPAANLLNLAGREGMT